MSQPQVVTVTLNPAIDQTLRVAGLAVARVNRALGGSARPGGKGVNVACFLADLGVSVAATGFLGAGNAELFETVFASKGIDDRLIRIPGCTRVDVKIVDDLAGETTEVNPPGLAPRVEDLERLLERLDGLVRPGVWVALSGSVPPGVVDAVYAEAIDLVHRRGGRVLLDTSGPPLRQGLAGAPEIVKPNLEELGELLGEALETIGGIRTAAGALLERGVRLAVVSLGERGALFAERGRTLLARPPRVAARGTVGAGDAMAAGLLYGRLHGLPLEDLARMATAAGAYAVTASGPGIAERSVLRALIERVEIGPAE